MGGHGTHSDAPMLAKTAARFALLLSLMSRCSDCPCESIVTSSGPKPLMRNFQKALGMQVVHVDSSIASIQWSPARPRRDHGEIGAPRSRTRRACLAHAAFADDQFDAVAFHQRPREALHAHRSGGADAQRLVTGAVARPRVDLRTLGAYARRRALEIERVAAAVEHGDQRGVANA